MLPDCNTIYENLKTSFVDVPSLGEDLRNRGLDGYLRYEGEGEEGVIVLENGVPERARIESRGTDKVIEEIDGLESVVDGEYILEVADCDDTELEIVSSQMTGEVIEEDLSTRYINLRNYLLKLEEDFDGYLTINEDEIQGMVTIKEGDPSGAILEADGESVMGNEAVEDILEMSESRNLHLDVYKVESETEDGETTDEIKQEIENISENFEDKADEILEDMGLETDEI